MKLDIKWVQYDYTISELYNDPKEFYKPNPYRISGTLRAGDAFLQAFYSLLTTPEHEKNQHTNASLDDPYGSEIYSLDGSYFLQAPVFLGEDVDWPKRAYTLDKGKSFFPMGPPKPLVFTAAHGMLEQNYTRMRGKRSYKNGNEMTKSGDGEWDLHRVATCPPPPRNIRKESGDCDYERYQLKAAKQFLETVDPVIDKIGQELERSTDKLDQLINDLAFYEEFFKEAMGLAVIGDASWIILEILGPLKLKAAAPTQAHAKRVEVVLKFLAFLRDPVKWTLSETFPDSANVYEIILRYQILADLIERRYEPILNYIDEHVNKWAPDNPLGNKARKFVETAKALVPLMRKIALLTEEGTRLQAAIKKASLEAEYWEKELSGENC